MSEHNQFCSDVDGTLKIAYDVHTYKVLTHFACTFCPTKTKIVQTASNFGWKMSDVRLLFQALLNESVFS